MQEQPLNEPVRSRRRLGMDYEKKAAEYLKDRGLELIDSNFRCRYGEIDLIMRDGSCIVFVEVKYRSGSAYGYPLEAVNTRKINTIRFVAGEWLHMHRFSDETPCRFDVVGILNGEICWVKDAFM